MCKLKVEDIVVLSSSSIKNAMRIIDKSGLRLVFVINEGKKLLGIVSDSEIRKFILKGNSVSENITKILNPNPIVINRAQLENPYEVKKIIRQLLQKMPGSSYVLVVDNERKVKNLIAISDLVKGEKISSKKHSNGKRVLVIGGAGYLGCVLVPKLLELGYKVRILDNLMYGSDHLKSILSYPDCELLEGDIRNISTLVLALSDADAVINLAAIVGDPACKNDPGSAIEINYLANKVVAETCKYFQVNRFIYASTCSVYGEMDGENKLTENSPLNPVSLYAKSKIQSEEGILELADENFSPVILRMGTLYGYSPRMRFDLVANAMTKTAVIENKIHVHSGGKQWRPMLNVVAAADAYIKCLEASLEKVGGEIFNVGCEKQNYRIIDIARLVKKCVPQAELIIEETGSDPRNYFVSFSKIEKVLGFKVRYTLEQSIKQIAESIKKGYIKNVNDAKYYNLVIDS